MANHNARGRTPALDETEELEELDSTVSDATDEDEDDAGWMTQRDNDDLWDSTDDEDDDEPLDDVDANTRGDVDRDDLDQSDRFAEGAGDEEIERPLGEYFTSLALAKLPAKMRGRPLSAQANDWILSTIGRLVDAQPPEGSPLRSDLACLLAAAETREILTMLTDHTLDEARRLTTVEIIPADYEIVEPAEPQATAPGVVLELSIFEIAPDPDQPRDEGADEEIGAEIHPDTVLPPIEVRPHPVAGGPAWMIVDGERRYRGSLKAGRTTIRAIVNDRPMDPGDLLLRQSALNQGKRLKPLEEARAWKRVCDAKGWNASQLADYLKKPRSTVADRLAILEAPKPFHQLFLDGHLTAAAAPIVRQYAEVPETILARAIAQAKLSWEWREAIDEGKPVPLAEVKAELQYQICEAELRVVPPELKDRYAGETVKIGKTTYAINVDALDKLVEEYRRANAPVAPTPKRQEPSQWQLEERKRQKAVEKKAELRRAQFAALNQKLPAAVAGPWLLPVVKWVVAEMTQDTLRAAVKVLGIDGESKSDRGGFQFDKMILAHAEKLSQPQQAKLVLQLLLAHDTVVHSYSNMPADRFAIAAKLLKVDLGKVKVAKPDPAPKKTTAKKAPAKASAKKGAR